MAQAQLRRAPRRRAGRSCSSPAAAASRPPRSPRARRRRRRSTRRARSSGSEPSTTWTIRSASTVSSSVALKASTSWCGQLADEADRVGEQEAPALVLEGAGGRVERVEEPLPHPDLGARERVQQRRLARVRVAGQRDRRQRGALAPRAHRRPVVLGALQAPPQRGDPVAGEAAVDLDLGLAGAPGRGAAAARCRSRRARRSRWVHRPRRRARLYSSWASSTWSLPSAVWAWSAKMSRITAVRSITGTPELLLEVALLARRELVVGGDQVRVRGLDLALQLGDLAPAQVAVGVGLVAALDQVAGGRDARRCAAAPSARRADRRRSPGLATHADGERALARARVDDARVVRPSRCVRCIAAVAASLHGPGWYAERLVAGPFRAAAVRLRRQPRQRDVADERERAGRAGVGDRLLLGGGVPGAV